MRRLTRLILAIGVIAALGVVLAACGDDDDDDDAAATTAEAMELVLTGEGTTLALDPDTADVLEENSVTVAPVDPATAGDDGITFPITEGMIDSESLAGTISHSGGLMFSAGGTDLEVTDFVIDTTAGSLVATAGGDEIPLLAVDLTGVEQSDDDGTIVLDGITTSLTPEAAEALNTTFGVMLFEEGLSIGDVTVRATT